MRDLQKDLELCKKATPGPWQWDVSKISKSVELESTKGMHSTVIYFSRWGFHGAQPRFNVNGILESVEELAKERQSHHVGWDMDIIHPDAQFIAQAREGCPHAIERAIKAEKQLEELLAWEEPKEKCYLSVMRRIAELESLVRELVEVLRDANGYIQHHIECGHTPSPKGDIPLLVHTPSSIRSALTKAKEVLGDE